MEKKRVYTIADEIGITSKELIAKLEELDIKVSSHMSTLTREEADIIVEMFKEEKAVKVKPKEKEVKKVDLVLEHTEHEEEPENKKSEKQDKKEKNKKQDKKESKNTGHIEIRKEEKQDKPETEKQDDDGIIVLDETVVVGEFATLIGVPPTQVIMSLMKMGIMANINQNIKFETAEKIAFEFDKLVELKEPEEEKEDIIIQEDSEEDLELRPPIVTVMGHVDHGKTSLLDAIRKTKVTDKEAGGITQHIGASEVYINGKKVVFLDTPGHEAFTQMRLRGAQVTDIAILVVAADDGIMPQTIEAISHAKAANIPIIVAINKIDKPTANIEKVRQELSNNGLLVEDWGGDVIDVPVSAKKGENLDKLLEMVLLVAEMEELKANPNRPAVGTVIESNLDKGRGPVATVIVSNGTLKVGDPVIAGTAYGKIRALVNDKGQRVKKATPSTPVEILGLNEVPMAGDQFVVMPSEKAARTIGEKRRIKQRDEQMKATSKITLEDLFDKMQEGEVKELDIVLKADVQGSLEAIRQSIEKISNEQVQLRVIHSGVGAVADSDIMLASASNAIVIGFNVRPTSSAIAMAEREQVDMRTYRIIYELIEDIEKAMKGMLDPEYKEVVIGQAEVRETFKVSGVGTIAGSYVTEGKVTRSSKARLVRNGIVIYDGEVASIRRFRDDVKEVARGYECGITLANFNDIKEQDIIEAYEMQEIER
ncbi:translation initiation factor IF-2 [Peptoanaerobacter stomatis]|uniref:Translation initiation factor IF-2 n=1 Tax=Peptoanaerobacter stomatis TaxID=796937 RepID=J4WFH3_9FIRM|nr:translation initiation factor IF-2 [Peptoanaerobacter stomatis]EJU24031.1 translation initiation factor IF-2 [Peptoanaerobacter stomatis]